METRSRGTRFRATRVRTLVVAALAVAFAVAPTNFLLMLETPASAACSTVDDNWFKAYAGTYCSGALLLQARAERGTRNMSVARDDTESGSNWTGNKWCGVNEGWNDQTVFAWGPNTIANTLGSANNTIDHFDVVGRSERCPA